MIFRHFKNCNFYLIIIVIHMTLLLTVLSYTRGLAQAIIQENLFQIAITGVDGEIKKNIEALLVIPHGMIRDGRIDPNWAKRFARQAKTRIPGAMEPFGYYEARSAIELERLDGGRYLLKINITPGEPVVIDQRAIRISGAGYDEPRLTRLIKTFPLKAGDPLQHKLYEESKGALLEAAISMGYLEAYFPVHEVRVYQSRKKADIELELETGPRYRFGDIRFLGAETLPDSFLRRSLTFETGDFYAGSELAKTQSNLLDSDKFRTGQVNALIDQAQNNEVPIEISLVPLPRFQLKPGLGYGTDTGPRASLRFKDKNGFSLGHEFKADLMFAELRQTATSSYLVPLGSKADSILALSLQYDREDNDTYATRSIATESSLTHGFIKGLSTTLFLRLSIEEYEFAGEPLQATTLVMPGARIGQRLWKFDQPGRVLKGYAWQAEIRGSAMTLGSDVSVLQGIIGGGTVFSLSKKNKLILRAESGTTMQNDFDDLPPSMRFFAGGDQSIRGYAYKTLGPKDALGNTVGGRHLIVGSVEGERIINKDWSVALFYDTGNAFDSFNDYEPAQGAGVGVRRYTPIGPIKLDVARQLGQGNNNYRLHLSVGFGW